MASVCKTEFFEQTNKLDKFSIKYMNSLTLNQGIAANINYDIGGFCAIKKAGATFNPSLHMRWAVDLFDRELKCELNQCKMFCGDGVCDYGRGENETTCPNDCSITNMQCPASRRRFLEMIKYHRRRIYKNKNS